MEKRDGRGGRECIEECSEFRRVFGHIFFLCLEWAVFFCLSRVF